MISGLRAPFHNDNRTMRVEGSDSLVVVFHRTNSAALEAIRLDGFVDSEGWRRADGERS